MFCATICAHSDLRCLLISQMTAMMAKYPGCVNQSRPEVRIWEGCKAVDISYVKFLYFLTHWLFLFILLFALIFILKTNYLSSQGILGHCERKWYPINNTSLCGNDMFWLMIGQLPTIQQSFTTNNDLLIQSVWFLNTYNNFYQWVSVKINSKKHC